MNGYPALADHQQVTACKDCSSDLFFVIYDSIAMAYNVECAECGTSMGDLR